MKRGTGFSNALPLPHEPLPPGPDPDPRKNMNSSSVHSDPADTRPILIVPYMWIGDFVRGHTVVRVLNQRWPNRPVDLLTTSLCAPLVDYMPGVRKGILAQQSAQIDSAVLWSNTSELEVAAGATVTINGPLQGGGRIDKIGDGEVVLNGVGTGRSGATNVAAGTLRVTTASMSGGVPGYGSGAIFPKSGGTLHLDAIGGDMEITSPGGIIHMGVDAVLRVTGNVTYRRNYPEFIADDALGAVSSTIRVDAGGTLLYRAQLRNDRTTEGSLHTIRLDGPGTVKLTSFRIGRSGS